METGVVYKIQNKLDGKPYIGMSKDYKRRWKEHRDGLRKDKHPNNHLQRAWNRDGEENFKFEIIHDGIPLGDLVDWEMYYITEIFNTYKGFGYNQSHGDYYILTEEDRKKISEQNSGESSPMATLTKKQCLDIYKKYYNSHLLIKNLKNEYNACRKVIYKIVTNRHWSTKGMSKDKRATEKQKKRKKREANWKYSIRECKEFYYEYFNTDITQQGMNDKYGIGRSVLRDIIYHRHYSTKNMPEFCRVKNVREKLRNNSRRNSTTKEEYLEAYRLYLSTDLSQAQVVENYNFSRTILSRVLKHTHWSTKDLTKEEIMNME